MSVKVSSSDNSKTIQPTDESLGFTSYVIKGRYGTNEDWIVNESFSSKSIKIDNLEVGSWEFVVEGFNKDGMVLAKSEPHVVAIKTNGLAKETYTLDWVEGFGSLKLSVKVQSSRISSIECQLYDESDNEVGDSYTIEKESSALGDDGLYLFEKVFDEVPTGFYNAKIVMKDKDGEPLGKTFHQSVHIHDGLESSFDFSWKGFPNLMPQVDVPKPSSEDGTSIPCDSKILLSTEEEDTSIFYSFDGKSYSSYTEDGIDLSQMQGLSSSIKVWVYAEKSNLNKSSVGTYSFNIEHNPDRENAVYTWNAIEDGYECIATSKCQIHNSVECETEKAVVSYEVLVDSTEHEEGKCRYTAVFGQKGYETQTKDGVVSTKHRLLHHTAKSPTCTEIGWNEYDSCSDCDYTTYKEIAALGHDPFFKRVNDEQHKCVCNRCGKTINTVSHSFKDYKCEICGVWGRGPSGGYVFYDRGAYTEGVHSWRYLEAAPADLRLVSGVPTIDSTIDGYSNGTMYFIFGYYRTSSNGSNILLSTKTGIGEGYNNTDILVSNMKDAAYTYYSVTDTTQSYAARLCKVLEYEVNGEVFKDWFLPSNDELKLMYENLHKQGLDSFANNDYNTRNYWSSSEGTAYDAWTQAFSSGNQPPTAVAAPHTMCVQSGLSELFSYLAIQRGWGMCPQIHKEEYMCCRET